MPSLRSLFGEDAAILRETDFQALLLAMMIVPLGNGLVSPILDSLLGPLDASAAEIGLMISFFWAPSIVIVPVTGVLADRYGRKAVLVPAILLFGLAGIAIASTADFRLVLGLRLLQGVGWAGIAPVITTSIGDLYAGAREATAQGLRVTGAGIVGSATPLLAGVLVGAAWQYPFVVYAAALPVAGAVYLWFDGSAAGEPEAAPDGDGEPEGASEASDGGASQDSGGGARADPGRGASEAPGGEGASEASDGGEESYARALFELARRRRVVAIVVARALPLAVWIGFVTYNSIIVVRLLGGTPVQAGALYAVTSLVFALSASQAGRVTARFDGRFVPVIGATVALGAGFAATVLAPDILVAVLGMTVAGTGFGIAVSLYTSILTGLAPPSLRGGLVSIGATTSRTVGTVTPIVLGAVISAATPALGFGPAVRLAGLGAVAVGAGGSLLGFLVASAAPRVPAERPGAAGD